MKKRLVFIHLFVLFSFTKVAAQEQKTEFSRFEISASTGYVMTGMPKGGQAKSFPLEYDLTFRFFPKSWLSVGLSAGNDRGVYWGEDFTMVLTPTVYFHWLRKKSFSAYSGVGYSVPLRHIAFKEWSLGWYEGFQYTPIGITFGRSLFGLAELGYGIRYYPVRLGIGYRF